jgi:transcriptional regulator with GAF, ATPase, and Fis domain
MNQSTGDGGRVLTILGDSVGIRNTLARLALVAATTASVLLHGETGTGKELFARRLHQISGRPGAFVPVNCAAISPHLVESELFGHRRGAFTGANTNFDGRFVASARGTLFLDEIAELDVSAQAKLLRVLDQRSVTPVGGVQERPVDLRVVAATHRDLRSMVQAGQFREDLYFRLARCLIEIPPLRSRGHDVVMIAREMANRGIDGAPPRELALSAARVLLAYEWPGNVRELANVIFQASLLATGGAIRDVELRQVLPERVEGPASLEARIQELLAGESASSAEVAAALGVSPATARRTLRAMVDAGVVVASGDSRSTRYWLVLR